ncbi:XcyI family restriction endonuclease [Symbiobacterium terraclitae]|uniref:XcyI family restriction endonuclease n=1 Tax=Symbiobacterium terraclitae TaxID=557451 RepID=UPI0035B53925
MARRTPITLPDPLEFPAPDSAINFGTALEAIRQEYMVQALLATVEVVDIHELNRELSEYVPASRIRELAGIGLRAELIYPVPCLLKRNPRLLAYYRLLLGYSGKRFFRINPVMHRFENMEKKGTLDPEQEVYLPAICRAFISAAQQLVDGLGLRRISRDLLDDLQLLTLGSSLQGARNVEIGQAGAREVRDLIEEIVRPYITTSTATTIKLVNLAGREVVITTGMDPDVRIEEYLTDDQTRKILAIEVKAGEDGSNIYNRLGEAEKSHLTAREDGFTECWTIAGTKKLDLTKARQKTPSTNEFWLLAEITNKSSLAYRQFRQRIEAYVGIPSSR